jgi:dUTPase
MKIAQMVITSFIRTEIEMVDKLNTSTRGLGGFGSTGMLQ